MKMGQFVCLGTLNRRGNRCPGPMVARSVPSCQAFCRPVLRDCSLGNSDRVEISTTGPDHGHWTEEKTVKGADTIGTVVSWRLFVGRVRGRIVRKLRPFAV
jgi:hypothetical protein